VVPKGLAKAAMDKLAATLQVTLKDSKVVERLAILSPESLSVAQ
jgi:hypothetical protein